MTVAAVSGTAASAQTIVGIKKETPVIVAGDGTVIGVPRTVIGDPVILDDDRRIRRHRTNLPPGQAKKLYGAKSAREFAPGQQKKRYNNWQDRNEYWSSNNNDDHKKGHKHHGKGKGKHKG